MNSDLEYLGRTHISNAVLWPGWIDVREFRFPATTAPVQALQALIGHWRYRDGYDSPGSDSEPDSRMFHGPFKIARLSVEKYQSISADDARILFQTFVWDGFQDNLEHGRIAESDYPTLAAWVAPLYAAIDGCEYRYHLAATEDERHELGWIVNPFHELVLINPAVGQLTLAVAAID